MRSGQLVAQVVTGKSQPKALTRPVSRLLTFTGLPNGSKLLARLFELAQATHCGRWQVKTGFRRAAVQFVHASGS